MRADQHQAERVGQRVDIEAVRANHQRSGQQRGGEDKSHQKRGQSRVEEEPARAVEQQEAEMTPAVSPGAQMRRARAAVGRESGGHLGHAQPGQRAFDHHLGCKLHSRGAQIQPEDRVAAEGAQPAVEVAHRDGEEDAPDGGQDGVANVFVQRRHGTALDRTGEAVAHHQVVSLVEPGKKTRQVLEVVAGVGVGHHDVPPARGFDACDQRGPIATGGDIDDARSLLRGDALRAIRGSVISDQDLAGDAAGRNRRRRLTHAEGQCLGLIQTRHKNREVEIGHGENGNKTKALSVVRSSLTVLRKHQIARTHNEQRRTYNALIAAEARRRWFRRAVANCGRRGRSR